ncbi:hypothetical protein C9374_006642 [Naegleria lovaniensis]|uniref:Uncharacterized protein n=1 Tax=Naegleria lovaniensis TaxID=51637 RepID=A0AA88KHF7_NAELO|nr:uncharacterized protein C9374_006642 [Naegleria lovaniensis]KAG2379525.1 hypothetical protein C9374_006642 [Naegleria lovaniensis]
MGNKYSSPSRASRASVSGEVNDQEDFDACVSNNAPNKSRHLRDTSEEMNAKPIYSLESYHRSENGRDEFLITRALFQVFGEHQNVVQGNINSQISKFLNGGEYIVKISSGAHHTLLMTNLGGLLSFGRNNDGQLGIGDMEMRYSPDICKVKPVYKELDEHAIDICCGHNHSVILTNYGRLMACGWNANSQCGLLSHHIDSFTIVPFNRYTKMLRCGGNSTCVLTTRNLFYITGSLFTKFTEFQCIQDFKELLHDGETIEDFQVGGQTIVVVTSFKNVYAFGEATYQQFGRINVNSTHFTNITKQLPFKSQNLLSFTCGMFHNVFLLDNGAIYTAGYNGYGQCGTGNLKDTDDFTLLTKFYKIDTSKEQGNSILAKQSSKKIEYTCFNVAEDEDGKKKPLSQPFTIGENEMIKSVYAGSYHTIFVSNVGHVYACGNNEYQQCNVPALDDEEETKSIPHIMQMNIQPKAEIVIFANSSANITIVAEKGYMNSFFYNSLKKRARQGELSDIVCIC